ncbi:MAG TPA: peptidylprolyl isomerase [Terriglobales bacterium]|jgi:hypothetical protein
MRIVSIAAVALIGSAALAQSAPADKAPRDQAAVVRPQEMKIAESKISSPAPAAVEVAPDAAVVTLAGVCDHTQKTGKAEACKTVVTRAQMDALVEILVPNATQEIRAQFAVNYARMLAAAEIAERHDLEKDPSVVKEIETREKLARMQALSSHLFRSLQQQANSVPQAQVLSYYQAHAVNFEQGEVLRLTLPKSAPTGSGTPLDPSAVQARAEALRTRAAAGEDFEKLQAEAYKDLDISGKPPLTRLSLNGRGSLPPEQAKVFDLQPGGLTEVIDSHGSLVILKLVSKSLVPIEKVQQQIGSVLQRERMQDELRLAAGDVKADFNLAYLQTSTAPELFPAPGASTPAVTNSNQRVWTPRRRGASVRALPPH